MQRVIYMYERIPITSAKYNVLLLHLQIVIYLFFLYAVWVWNKSLCTDYWPFWCVCVCVCVYEREQQKHNAVEWRINIFIQYTLVFIVLLPSAISHRHTPKATTHRFNHNRRFQYFLLAKRLNENKKKKHLKKNKKKKTKKKSYDILVEHWAFGGGAAAYIL